MVAMYLCVSACCGSADARQYKDRIPRRLWRWGDGGRKDTGSCCQDELGHQSVTTSRCWSHFLPPQCPNILSYHQPPGQMEGFYEMGATNVKVWKEYSWQGDGCKSKSKGCMSNNNSRCWLMMSVPDISPHWSLMSEVTFRLASLCLRTTRKIIDWVFKQLFWKCSSLFRTINTSF